MSLVRLAKAKMAILFVIGVLVLGLAVLAGVDTSANRDALIIRIAELDGILVQQRAIARDLPLYRAEIERTAASATEAERRTNSDLRILREKLGTLGVLVTEHEPIDEKGHRRRPLTLSGRGTTALGETMTTVRASDILLELQEIDFSGLEWSLEATAFQWVQKQKPQALPSSWAGGARCAFGTSDLCRQIDEKRAELDRLREVLSEVTALTEKKMRFKEQSRLIEEVRARHRDLTWLVDPLFSAPDALFARGQVELEDDELHVTGKLRRSNTPDRAKLARIFGEDVLLGDVERAGSDISISARFAQ